MNVLRYPSGLTQELFVTVLEKGTQLVGLYFPTLFISKISFFHKGTKSNKNVIKSFFHFTFVSIPFLWKILKN